MLNHVIRNTTIPNKFILFWTNDRIEVLDSKIILDFNPIINQFNLTGNFTLLHFQAKPKPIRRWGCFKSLDNSYHSCDNVTIKSGFLCQTLSLNEKIHNTLPTSVLYYPDSDLIVTNGIATIFKYQL